MVDVGETIRGELSRRGWTVYVLADRLDDRVARQSVYNCAAGKPVSAATLLAVLDALELDITPRAPR